MLFSYHYTVGFVSDENATDRSAAPSRNLGNRSPWSPVAARSRALRSHDERTVGAGAPKPLRWALGPSAQSPRVMEYGMPSGQRSAGRPPFYAIRWPAS